MKTVQAWFDEQEPKVKDYLISKMRLEYKTRVQATLKDAIAHGTNTTDKGILAIYYGITAGKTPLQSLLDWEFDIITEKGFKAGSNIGTSYTVQADNRPGITVLLVGSPFGNCQMYTIGYFSSILRTHKDEVVKSICRHLNILSGRKKIMMIDVRQEYGDRVRKMFAKEEIISDVKYKSTNGSQMEVFMIKATAF